ncbi:hypothetical protein HPB47_000881, partial [Ixodes persulcatus]
MDVSRYFSTFQKEQLTKAFVCNAYPDTAQQRTLAFRLGLTTEQVKGTHCHQLVRLLHDPGDRREQLLILDVVSLLNYEDDGGATTGQVIRAGYPAVCVLPCESHRPNLEHGYTLCRRAPDDDDDTVFGVSYWWQVSDRGAHPPLFETVTQATPFTAARRR